MKPETRKLSRQKTLDLIQRCADGKPGAHQDPRFPGGFVTHVNATNGERLSVVGLDQDGNSRSLYPTRGRALGAAKRFIERCTAHILHQEIEATLRKYQK